MFSDEIKHTLQTQIVEWCEKNPYEPYCDYRDEFPENWAEKLLAAKTEEEFQAAQSDIECELYDTFMDDRWRVEIEQFATCLKEIDGVDDVDLEPYYALDHENASRHDADLYEALKDHFQENFCYDTGKYLLEVLSRGTSHLHVVAIPLQPEGAMEPGEPFETVTRFEYDEDYVSEIQKNLETFLGFTQADSGQHIAETMYDSTYLKLCGTLDWREFWEGGKPLTQVKVNGLATSIWHNGFNGSGNCWEGKITVDVWMNANFRIDDSKYGIQSVYGFVNRFWQSDLEVK